MATKTKTISGFILSAAMALLLARGSFPAAAAPADEIELKSETAVLMDAGTGQVLFDKEMRRRMYPASITKIMTALLALEHGDLGSTVTMSHDAVFSIGQGTSHIALDEGEKLTLEQALYALALASANDAANGIAEHIGGTMENFAAMMNERAREAGSLETHFTNAHGLFDENHYTTAYDMARITQAALEIPAFEEIFSALVYDIPPTNMQRETRHLWASNVMIAGAHRYEGVVAGKIGWIEESEFTLVTAARRDGRTLIAVVMKAPERNGVRDDTAALLDYGFSGLAEVVFPAEETTGTYEETTSAYADVTVQTGPPTNTPAAGPESKPPALPMVLGVAGLLLVCLLIPKVLRHGAAKRRCKRKRSLYALPRMAESQAQRK